MFYIYTIQLEIDMGFIITSILTALFNIATRIATAEVAESILVTMLVNLLEKAVASTKNTVDDEMVRPIIKALKNGQITSK